MKDEFTQDSARRAALKERVIAARAALADAFESGDGAAALQALGDAYDLIDSIPDAQLLYVGDNAERSVAFALPVTCRQMVAQWGGSCILCDDRIRQGDIMYWDKVGRAMTCARCSVKELMGQR
jgi:hypothetical protein